MRLHPVSIDGFLASHDGVISLDQARRGATSDDQVARKVASGEWVRRARAVYFAIAWAWTPAARVRVAAEWVRPAGTLVGVAAAWAEGWTIVEVTWDDLLQRPEQVLDEIRRTLARLAARRVP